MQPRGGSLLRRGLKFRQLIVNRQNLGHYRDRATLAFRSLKEYSRIHQSLIILTIFVLINNALIVRAAGNTPDLYAAEVISDPYEIADTVRLLADYTPHIEENPDSLALHLEEQITGDFITTNPLIATLPGEAVEPTPAPAPQEAERTRDVKYTVQIGDTLGGIGSQFGLRIATLQIKNNLRDADSIKPGLELTIPAQDLSDKAIQAAEDRKKASAQLASASSRRVISGTRRGDYGLIAPIRHNGVTRRLVGGHTGVDYRANTGTPVASAADGVVVRADGSGWNGGYGDMVVVSHGGGKVTYYAHLSRVAVSNGERVGQGEIIGYSGSTGRSTGPHLHFELRVNGRAVDPGV